MLSRAWRDSNAIGTRADRVGRERVGGRRGCRGHHHSRTVGQYGKQRRERLVELQDDGRGIHHLDRGDGRKLAFTSGFAHRLHPLDVRFDRLGIERRAVMEGHVFTQRQGEGGAVVVPAPFRRQLRHDPQALVDVQQLVAHRVEDDAARIGSAGRRIERIGVVLQCDAQGRGQRARSRHAQQRGQNRDFSCICH